MIPMSPRVVWRGNSGHAAHAGVVVQLDEPPPVKSLATASIVEWIPAQGRALVIQDGAKRSVTDPEAEELVRWITWISTDALAARDRVSPPLVIVVSP